jgi:hypothetical protein
MSPALRLKPAIERFWASGEVSNARDPGLEIRRALGDNDPRVHVARAHPSCVAMNGSAPLFPSREESFHLHLRLCDHEADAPADVCRAYLLPLQTWAANTFPREDPHLRDTAVHKALFDYVQHPRRYDPARLDLAAYLQMAAGCDLRNLRRAEARHQRRRVAWNSVEETAAGGKYSGADDDPAVALERVQDAEEGKRLLESVTEGWDEKDRRALNLMLEGERRTAAYAEILEIGDRPAEEQEREVKKLKDRIKRRLERKGERYGR